MQISETFKSFRAIVDNHNKTAQRTFMQIHLEETSAQMKNLFAANQTTRQNLFDLTTRLSTFVNNVNDISDELERSTKIIYDSLDNYNAKTNAGLREKLEAFDNSMNQAFSYLNELVEELSSVVEDEQHKLTRLRKIHSRLALAI